MKTLLGSDALTIVGRNPSELLHLLGRHRIFEGFAAVAAHPDGRITVDYRVRHSPVHFTRFGPTAVHRLRNECVVKVMELPAHMLPSRTPPSPLDDDEGFARTIDEAIEKASGDTSRFSVMVLELERAENLVKACGREIADRCWTKRAGGWSPYCVLATN